MKPIFRAATARDYTKHGTSALKLLTPSPGAISRVITKRIVSEVLQCKWLEFGRERREHFGYNALN
jgi:hypothetical protein